jgi:hypothetical protein
MVKLLDKVNGLKGSFTNPSFDTMMTESLSKLLSSESMISSISKE